MNVKGGEPIMTHQAGYQERGQSTLEYILVLAAIIAAVAIASQTVLNTGITNTMTNAGAAIEDAATTLSTRLK